MQGRKNGFTFTFRFKLNNILRHFKHFVYNHIELNEACWFQTFAFAGHLGNFQLAQFCFESMVSTSKNYLLSLRVFFSGIPLL